MGQCVSSKAAAVGAHNSRPMSRPLSHASKLSDEVKDSSRRSGNHTRGVATSFGFRKRPETAIPVYTDNCPRRLASVDNVDNNGNDGTLESFETSGTNVSGRLAQRLPAPKKEPNATSKVSRFGFRQSSSARINRIPNPETQPITSALRNKNNNQIKPKAPPKTVTISPSVPVSRPSSLGSRSVPQRPRTGLPIPAPAKYTFHSSQLPKPQLPVRVQDTKTAKTAANINRKVSTGSRSDEGGSSKESSIAGDSGVGSQTSHNGSNGNGQDCVTDDIRPPPRHLNTLVSGQTFDVRDLDPDLDEDGVVTEVAVIPLPRLPSVFANNISTGIVRERTREYQRQLDKFRPQERLRESDDDFGEEEKSFRDLSSNEKFGRERRYLSTTRYGSVGSPPSTSGDEQWAVAGEAMLDSNLYHFSSSDESRERDRSPIISPSTTMDAMTSSGSYTGAIPKAQRVMLTIEDPFAAVAAKSGGTLLDDETSPQDSLISSFTESEDQTNATSEGTKKQKSRSTSGSKDVDEKSPTSPRSPGTPTNTSLSLSEGRDFLIDDEIADQPALMFNEPQVEQPLSGLSEHNNANDSVATLVETPKRLRRLHLGASIAASIDTLSPCESIASDDLMLDFEHSQSSGIDDSTDRLNESSALHSLDEVTLRSELELQNENVAREWSSLLGTHNKEFSNSISSRTGSLGRSPARGPCSVPESPRLLQRARIPGPQLLRGSRTAHGTPTHQHTPELESTALDLVEIKSLVLRLQNVLQEAEGDILLRKESPLSPFDSGGSRLKNGTWLGHLDAGDTDAVDAAMDGSVETQVSELRKQVLFLQTQLEERDRTVAQLQGRVAKFSLGAQLRPREQIIDTCNAATQTDRVRPVSAGPSLLQSLPGDSNLGPLVSASERRCRPQSLESPPLRLWRRPGEPPPARYVQSPHQRSHSRTRVS